MLSSMHNIQSISLYICCICVILPVSNLHVLQLYSCIVNVERDSESKPLESPGSLWMKLLWPSKTIQQENFIQGNVPQKDLSSVFPISLKDGDGIPTRNTTWKIFKSGGCHMWLWHACHPARCRNFRLAFCHRETGKRRRLTFVVAFGAEKVRGSQKSNWRISSVWTHAESHKAPRGRWAGVKPLKLIFAMNARGSQWDDSKQEKTQVQPFVSSTGRHFYFDSFSLAWKPLSFGWFSPRIFCHIKHTSSVIFSSTEPNWQVPEVFLLEPLSCTQRPGASVLKVYPCQQTTGIDWGILPNYI